MTAIANGTSRVQAELIERCQWYELALLRHGFTSERLMRLARKVATDALRLRGSSLQDRFDDLVSRLVIAGLQSTLRYDPGREQLRYGRNGGDPFASYIADIMDKRVDDYFRSKAEGFGDRRHGNDNRIVLSDEIGDEADPDIDFEKLISEGRIVRWQNAAEAVEMSMHEWVVVTLDRAARQIERTAA